MVSYSCEIALTIVGVPREKFIWFFVLVAYLKITQNWGVIVSKLWTADDIVNDVSGLFNVAMLRIRYRHEAAVGSKIVAIDYVLFEFHYNSI